MNSAMVKLHHEFDEEVADTGKAFHECDGLRCSNIIMTPNGTRYWIPDVTNGEKPVDGIVFESFEDAKKMYEDYADNAGFVSRLSTVKWTQDVVTHRYIVCNKAGKPRNKSVSTLVGKSGGGISKRTKRQRNFKVTNCLARVKFKVIPGTSSYRLYEFVERHNHQLLEHESKGLNRARQKLQCFKQLISNSNMRRDVNDFVGERDAQMLVDKLKKLKQDVPNFFFEYKCDNSVLASLFWADEVAKINYDVFGDVVSLGVTYGTNKHNMIFVSFTGFDHHKKCVLFGGGLLSSETTEAYNWLLQMFLKAHVKQPQLVLTDDDDDVKKAITLALPESAHRLSMSHIMNKMPLDVCQTPSFRKRLLKLVRNTHTSVTEFEESWHKLIAEYKLDEDKWLHDMFEIRERWIPTYFKDIPMCCLMKITSLAESVFEVNSHPDNLLVQFIMCFEHAMEAQRLNQRQLDHVTSTTTPMWITSLPIERYAANVYTRTLFTEVQKEIWEAMMSCLQARVISENGFEVHVIVDNRSDVTAEFKVVRNLEDHPMVCSCLNFVGIGYLCRHIVYVLRILGVKDIPDQYVLRRWKRDALPADILTKQRYGSINSDNDALMSDAFRLWGPT